LFQVFYDSYDEARDAVKQGNNIALIHIEANFSKSLQLFNDDPDYEFKEDGVVQVNLDNTDLQKSSLVERKLFETYESFIEDLMYDCGKSRNAGKLVVSTSAIVGKFDFDFKGSLLPGFVLV
jgi:hypothetical protein